MHDIEPYFRWRDDYIAAEDKNSPFYRTQNSEFSYTNTVYNYYIHPQWDFFGSNTLYAKILFADYDDAYAIIEFIGEWNDCLYNDIDILKRSVIDQMIKKGIYKYILICENVFNFHGSDDSYYEEWYDDIRDEMGWIVMLNTLEHVEEELKRTQIHYYINFGDQFADVNWRPHKPERLFNAIEDIINGQMRRLR